jgi:hypothetical protein
MNPFKMTQSEYDRLNPSFAVGDVVTDDHWQYVGHIPAPKTRLGRFVYNIIHGLAMRYRLLPVLAFSLRELFQPTNERTSIHLNAIGDGLTCDYDTQLDTLHIYFNGAQPHIVDFVNSSFAILRDAHNDTVIGVMVEGYSRLVGYRVPPILL